MIILDADILIEIFEKGSVLGENAFSRINESFEEFATTAISMHEVLYGIKKYGGSIEYVTALPIIAYTREDAMLSAELERKAEMKGKKVSRPDTMIAAIVINAGAKLYTNNVSHFKVFESFGLELF